MRIDEIKNYANSIDVPDAKLWDNLKEIKSDKKINEIRPVMKVGSSWFFRDHPFTGRIRQGKIELSEEEDLLFSEEGHFYLRVVDGSIRKVQAFGTNKTLEFFALPLGSLWTAYFSPATKRIEKINFLAGEMK